MQLAGGGGGGDGGGHIDISVKFCQEPSEIPVAQFEHTCDQKGPSEHGTLIAKSALLSSIVKLEKLDALN
jgi:hypothetical protein